MLSRQIDIKRHDDHSYWVCQLTKQIAKHNSTQLILIHNIIPYVHWETSDLLADSSPKGITYRHKWELSFVVFDQNQVVGFLIAYMRGISDTHPFESIYIHRLAVAPDHQGIGVGSKLLQIALNSYAHEFPNILTYTVQTNDEEANKKVIEFYQLAGFRRFLPVHYPEKLDILMKLARVNMLADDPIRFVDVRQPSAIV